MAIFYTYSHVFNSPALGFLPQLYKKWQKMDKKLQIINWINTQTNPDTLFLSVRFKTPPTNTEELCRRCKPIFQRLFRKLIGRQWYKLHERHFKILGFKEYGLYGNMHAHFLLICHGAYTSTMTQSALQALSDRLRMDIWLNDTEKTLIPKQYPNDIMIEKAYSNGVAFYTTKEIRIKDQRMSDNLILDVDLFN